MDNNAYPNINLEKTGLLLKKKVAEQGYTVKDIQKRLRLSCPQPIYRWFKGKVLPSLDHLLMLSRILKVHMEELLVVEEEIQGKDTEGNICGALYYYDIREKDGYMRERHILSKNTQKRMLAYWRKWGDEAA